MFTLRKIGKRIVCVCVYGWKPQSKMQDDNGEKWVWCWSFNREMEKSQMHFKCNSSAIVLWLPRTFCAFCMFALAYRTREIHPFLTRHTEKLENLWPYSDFSAYVHESLRKHPRYVQLIEKSIAKVHLHKNCNIALVWKVFFAGVFRFCTWCT